MPFRGKWRVLGSNFQELQMAPLLLTTGNRLHLPGNTHVDAEIKWLWINAQSKGVFRCLLPQIELILAVGRKLSTKSDIKLPRSFAGIVSYKHACFFQVHIRLLHTDNKSHTHPMWQLPLWVQFSDFCNSKIGRKKASISVKNILHHLKYTPNGI